MALVGSREGRAACCTGVCRLERVKLLVSVCPLYVEREICVCALHARCITVSADCLADILTTLTILGFA